MHYWGHRSKVSLERRKKQNGRTLFSLFEEIWNEREHVSFLSGKKLGKFNVSYFAHVVARSKSLSLSYSKENIVLLTVEEHSLFDHGTEAQREMYAIKNSLSWDRLFKLRDLLLKSS